MSKITPDQLEDALAFYTARIKGQSPANPNNFPTNPSALIDVIAEAAFSVDQLPKWSLRLKRITKANLKEVSMRPVVARLIGDIDANTGELKFQRPDISQLDEQRRLITQITRQYEPVPRDADALSAAQGAARIAGEAAIAYGLMKAKGWAMDKAFGSEEFAKAQFELNESLASDAKDLAKNPVFQRYIKDYPIVGDAIMLAFTGTAGALIIPAREMAVFSMIAADDPKVRQHALNIASFNGGDMGDELQGLTQAAADRIEKAVFSREVQQRRLPVDMVVSSALTSPAFLKMVGLPTSLPRNLIIDALNGTKRAAISLKDGVKNQTVRKIVDWFRDRTVVRGEKLKEVIYRDLEGMLGKETGPEIVAQIRERVDDTLSKLEVDSLAREAKAARIYETFQDQIRSRFVGLTQEEKVAAILRHQKRADLATPEIVALIDSPKVVRAQEFIDNLVTNLRKADPSIPARSNYFPAYESHIKDTWDAIRKAATEPYKKKREIVDAVVPTVLDVDSKIDDLVFRAVAPELNALQTKSVQEAETISGVILDEVQSVIKDPAERLKLVKDAMAEVPSVKRGAAAKLIGQFYNAGFLTARFGAWTFTEGLDGAVNFTTNILNRIKAGKAISFEQMAREVKPPAQIISDMISNPMAAELADVWRPITWLERVNDLAFRGNKMFDKWRSKQFFDFNYGSELADMSAKAGVPVAELGDAAKQIATKNAIEATKRFGLAFSFSSGLTTSLPGSILFPYMGFWTKAMGRMAKDLGETPELFKAGALGLAKIREMNEEYPSEWRSQTLKIAGEGINVFQKLPVYGLVAALADSYSQIVPDEDGRRKKEAERIRAVAEKDPAKAFQMIKMSDADLVDYMVQQPGRAIANFFEYVNEAQFAPLGPPAKWALEKARLIEERSPHWFPGGRILENLFRGFGLYEPNDFNDKVSNLGSVIGDPSLTVGLTLGHLNPDNLSKRVRAFNQNKFDADVAVEYMQILHRENINPGKITDERRAQLMDQANKTVRVNMLQNYVRSNWLSLNQKDLPGVQELWNGLSEMYDRIDLIVPTNKQIEQIAAETGIEDPRVITEIWRKTWPGIVAFEKQEKDAKFEFLENFPGLDDFQAIQARRKEDDVAAGVRKARGIYGRMPYSDTSKFLPLDRVQRAFIQMLSSEPEYDEEGTVKGLKVKLKDPNGRGAVLLRQALRSPEEKLEHFAKGSPDNLILHKYWPAEYERMRLASPELSDSLYSNDDPKKIPIRQTLSNGIRYVLQTLEDDDRSQKLRGIFDAVSPYIPATPLEFPTNAARAFIQENPKTADAISKFLLKIGAAGGRLLVSDAGAIPLEEREHIDRAIRNPESQAEIENLDRAKAFIREQMQGKDLRNIDQSKKLREQYKDFYNQNPTAGRMVQRLRPEWAKIYNGVEKMSNGQGFTPDLVGSSVGEIENSLYWDWKSRIFDARRSGGATKEDFKQIEQEGRELSQFGVPFIEKLKLVEPASARELSLFAKGYTYRFGNYFQPGFRASQVAEQKAWEEISLKKPGESEPEYQSRVRALMSDTKALPAITYSRVISKLQEHRFEEADVLQKLRKNEYAEIPLDRGTRSKIDSWKNEYYANQDDIPYVAEMLRRDPEAVELIRQNDPRTYRSLENKMFGPIDSSYQRALNATGYSPQTVEYYRRAAPNSFSRQYYQDPVFRSRVDMLGITPPEPTAETAITRSFKDNITGKIHAVKIPSVFAADKDVGYGDTVPEGVTSNFSTFINYVKNRARTQDALLSLRNEKNPESLTEQEQAFIKMTPAEQVFKSFPGAVGQAFREGKFGPREVVGQLSELADFGNVTGALSQPQYEGFKKFIGDTGNVLGAAQFGYRMGKFLDDTFNAPSLSLQGKLSLYAPGEIKNIPVNDPSNQFNLPNSAAAPGGSVPQPTTGQQVSEAGAQAAGAGAGVAGALSAVAPAGSAIPGIGIALAAIAAGFTIYNIVQSGRQRKKAKAAAQAAEDARRREIEDARRLALNLRAQEIQRQMAAQRAAELERQRQLSERDFQQRTMRVLQEGATFAALAQQPREFVNQFINRFEPQVLEFTRRPTFDSRVGLIEQIRSRIPKARY